MLGSSPPPCSLSNHPRSPTTPLPSPIHRPNPSWTAPKPHPGRAELPRCCRSRSRLAARPSVTSCSRSAPLPCSRLPSPRLPLPAGSPRGKAEPVAGSGHGSCCHPRLPRGCSLCPPAGRQHRRTRGRGFLWLREDPTRMRSTQGGCLGVCCGFRVPTSRPARWHSRLQAFGEPRERAEHPRRVGTEEPPCCGWKGPEIPPNHDSSPSSVSPSPAAALGEPGQHGSAGELRQRRAGHAAEGARRRPAPAQGRPAASPGTGSAAPRLLQR